MNKSEQINELVLALSIAQSQIKGAKKDSTNPFFKSKYADLSSVWEACGEQLNNNGLAVMQLSVPSETDEVSIETVLAHKSGQWVSSITTIPVSKKLDKGNNQYYVDAHSYGSAMSYARRYGLSAIVSVATVEDDDGNAATAATPKQKKLDKNYFDEIEANIKKCITVDELSKFYKNISSNIETYHEKKWLVDLCAERKEEILAEAYAANDMMKYNKIESQKEEHHEKGVD